MKLPINYTLTLICIFCSLFSFGQNIRYVAPTLSGSGNGSNWANAMTLQNAINSATNNTELRLRQGTYVVNSTLEIDLYNINLSIIGGYSGVGTTRDYNLYPTILDGRNRVQIMKILFTNVTIDGLNFINGFATGDDEGGAAILVWKDNFKISNSTFKNNLSEGSRGAGAIYLKHGFKGDILIDNCIFENNRSNFKEYEFGQNGGGVIHNWSQNVTIRNSKFTDNYSENEGGAIYTWGENFVIENSEFENNISEKEGGAIHVNYYDLRISNSIFLNNISNTRGGAIHIESGSNFLTKIINSLFVENSANDIGGAVLNSNYTEITNSTFIRNSNTAIAHNFPPSSEYYTYRTNIYNSIFYQNTAKPGGYREDINSISLVIDNSDKDIRRNILQEYNLGTNNMVGVNPIFVNNTNNFRLQPTSPAVNAGNNALFNQVSPTTANTSRDLANNPRLFGTSIDYGAYELQQQPIVIPPCTTIILPAHNATNVPIGTTISWNAVTEATGYRLTIGTTSGGNDVLNNVDVGNVTTYNLPNVLAYNTTYYVDIIPYNATGDAQSCSLFSFTTELEPIVIPPCTTIVLPAHNATNVPIGTAISWNAVTEATGYRLTIGNTSGGNDILNNVDVGNVTTYDLPNVLDYNTTYYVDIIPYNATGDAQSCSLFSFTTELEPIVIPPCTTIILPAHNATNVPIGTAISWNNITNATGYRLTIGTTSGGNDVLNNVDVGNVTTYNLPNVLDYNTTYYVDIIPYNATGDAQSCSLFSFTTELEPIVIPPCTTIVLPAHNATNVPIGTAISWNAVTEATGYRLTIGTTSGGNDVLNNVDVGNVTTYNLPNVLAYNTTYYVDIIPYNATGDAQSCSQFSFTTELEPIVIPPCTTIVLPAHNATNVPIGTAISWNNITNATGYRLTIGTTSGGNDVLNNVDVGNVTTYNLPNVLDYNTTYYVDIIPYNATGDAQSCSLFSFTTELEPCFPIEAEVIIIGNSVTINVLNSNPPFEFNLDNTGWVSSNVFNNLDYGLHQIEIKSRNDCRTILTFEILEMQNFISPNGDGINDELDFSFLRLKQNVHLLIVDRFGKTIFKDDGENNFIWNGKQTNGTTLPSNTYWYFIEWNETSSETKNKLQGSILLKNK